MTTPWQVRSARHGSVGALGLLVPIVLVDLGRFHVHSGIAVVNFVVVWFVTATLGLVVCDHVDRGVRARHDFLGIAVAVLAVNVALVQSFPYPVSMVGLPGEPISNMAPPTLVLALHAVVLILLVGWAWPWLEPPPPRPGAWAGWSVVTGVGALAAGLGSAWPRPAWAGSPSAASPPTPKCRSRPGSG